MVEQATNTQQSISAEQAQLLQSGLEVVGVENVPDVRRFADFLATVPGVEGGRELPERFTDAARELSKLVLDSELRHNQALIRTGHVTELEIRAASEFGLPRKLQLLAEFFK